MDEGVEGRRRAPGKSALHEAFRRGWPAVSSLVPQRVKQEVQRYLTCGDVRCGFVEVSCEDCHDSRLVAFSAVAGVRRAPRVGRWRRARTSGRCCRAWHIRSGR